MKKLLAILLIATAVLGGCTPAASKSSDGFIIWTDGYIAAAVDSTFGISLTYSYLKKPHFLPKEVRALNFADSTAVTVSSFEITELPPGEEYNGYGISIDIKFNEKGLWTVDALQMILPTGEPLLLPFGDIVFDVGDAEEDREPIEEIMFYSATGATSFSDFYQHDFSIPKKYELLKLYYGVDTYKDLSKGWVQSGKIPIDYEAPLIIISPKFEIIYEGETRIVYGSGCYCGALNVSSLELISSMERNKVSYISAG